MGLKLKPLKSQTIVITGASSGVGLATAKMAAEQGANVVLTARNEDALRQATDEINAEGGHAIFVVADVADKDALQKVADTAMERFGGFDTWVNDAGLAIIGRLEEITEEDARRMFDTNFWGVVNGTRIAAAHLKGKGGAIINLGSVESDMAVPLQGMYAASKHAVKGYTDAFRMELEQEGANVSVTLIKPSALDTPFTQNARNYLDHEPKLPPPVYDPKEAAVAILHAAAHPKRDIYVGGGGKAFSTLNKYAPRVVDAYNERIIIHQQERDEAPRNPQGALFRPNKGGSVRGDHPGFVKGTSLYTRAAINPIFTGVVLAAAGLAVTAWLGRDRIREYF